MTPLLRTGMATGRFLAGVAKQTVGKSSVDDLCGRFRTLTTRSAPSQTSLKWVYGIIGGAATLYGAGLLAKAGIRREQTRTAAAAAVTAEQERRFVQRHESSALPVCAYRQFRESLDIISDPERVGDLSFDVIGDGHTYLAFWLKTHPEECKRVQNALKKVAAPTSPCACRSCSVFAGTITKFCASIENPVKNPTLERDIEEFQRNLFIVDSHYIAAQVHSDANVVSLTIGHQHRESKDVTTDSPAAALRVIETHS